MVLLKQQTQVLLVDPATATVTAVLIALDRQ
jgi:hypothetical protein